MKVRDILQLTPKHGYNISRSVIIYAFTFFQQVVTAVKKKWRQCRLSKKRPWNSCSGVTSVSVGPKLLLRIK